MSYQPTCIHCKKPCGLKDQMIAWVTEKGWVCDLDKGRYTVIPFP